MRSLEGEFLLTSLSTFLYFITDKYDMLKCAFLIIKTWEQHKTKLSARYNDVVGVCAHGKSGEA